MTDPDHVMRELYEVIEARKESMPPDSYTASLFSHDRGENAVLEKIGEESTEVVLAGKDRDTDAIAHEAADLVYHLLVLLVMNDMPLDALTEELAARRRP